MNNIKKVVIVFAILTIGGTMMFNYFLKQMKNPSGVAGNFLFGVWNNTFKDMTKWGLDKIEISEYDMILDIGVGGGETLRNLAENTNGNKLYGIDISEDSIKFSSEVNQEYIDRGRTELLVADAASLPYENAKFDLVMTFQTHIYWDELEKGIAEMYRVLEVDGTMLIVCEKDKIAYHLKEYEDPQKFSNLLEDAEFKEVTYREQGNWIYFKAKK